MTQEGRLGDPSRSRVAFLWRRSRFLQDPLALALVDVAHRVAGLVGLLVFGFAVWGFLKFFRDESTRHILCPFFMLVGLVAVLASAVIADGLRQDAAAIREALKRSEVSIAIERDMVVIRAPEQRAPGTAFGRSVEVIEAAVVVDFPLERLPAVEKAIERDEALRMAYARLRRSTGMVSIVSRSPTRSSS